MRGLMAAHGARVRRRRNIGNRPASSVQPSELGEIGEYLDPDAFYPVSASGGVVSDVGDFQDPDYDLPASTGEGAAYVGEYIEPEDPP